MIIKRESRYGIRQQVLLITLLPLIVMTLILAGYFVSTRVADNQAALIERGQTMSRLLAEASEFGLISGLTPQLATLSQGPIQESDVADVIFLNNDKKLLYRSQQFELESERQLSRTASHTRSSGHWLFYTPVLSRGIIIGDSPEFAADTEERELLGWVVVALSTKPMHDRENQIISNGLMFLLIGFLITFVIAARFAETLSKPIIQLTAVVKKLEEGDLSARATVNSPSELGQLEKGINLLGAQVQSSNQRLESQVDKATQRLRQTLHHLETQNIALQRARQRADHANQAKDEFLARMSHELRTPLTSVLGFTRILQQADLNYEQAEYCRIINQTSSMLLSLIDDILDFAKLQSNAIRLEQIQFVPEQVIFEAIEMQSQSVAAKELELAYKIDSSVNDEVLGDPTRLRQVATNLISNAIKFTDNGQIIVHLRVINKRNNLRTLELAVEDTGIGISAPQQENLFNAFAQADSSITRRFGGSGLGLVIVQKLVQLMQGQVSLQSTENRGTRISCTFEVKAGNHSEALPLQAISDTDLIVFDRHPETLAAIESLAAQYSSNVYLCPTIQSLEKTLTRINNHNAALIFGLSANKDIASQQKLKIQTLFTSFPGKILLLTPALGNQFPEIEALRSNKQFLIASKPLNRQLIARWIDNSEAEKRDKPLQHALQKLNQTILVAEDNDFNRLLLHKIIKAAGGTVIEARNGQQAIELTRLHKPDAVVMDVHMPLLDGITATRILREDYPTLPIIALTANVISSEEHELRQAGISRIEYKPVNDQRLIRLLGVLTSQQSEETPLARTTDIKSISLSDYDVRKSELHKELKRLLNILSAGFRDHDLNAMRDSIHQLLGIAGLYQLPELESCCSELQQAVRSEGARAQWYLLSRLQRLIEHNQYEDD